MEIRPIDRMNRAAVDAFLESRWFSLRMAVHGECFDLGAADGWYAWDEGEIAGVITVRVAGGAMEILSLDSLREGRGIGSALLDAAVSAAAREGLSRIFLITTNDNLAALRFYQKRGFDIVRLDRNAVERARRIKPEIPTVGMDGIPLRHEIELEIKP